MSRFSLYLFHGVSRRAKFTFRAYAGGPSGFSLLEMLVAAAIFSLLCVLLLQIVSGASGSIRINQRRANADGQARFVLDRIGVDIEAMFPRRDLPRLFANATAGNDVLKFIADVPASSSERRAALVAWRIGPDSATGKPCLRRAAKGLDWTQAGWIGLRSSDKQPITFADISLPAFSFTDTDFDTLGEGIIRIGLTFQTRGSGVLTKNAVSLTNGSPDLSRTSSLSVTLVVLDAEASNNLTSAQMQGMGAAFPDPVDGTPLAQSWGLIAANAASFPGIPADAAKRVRVYQRFFPLPNYSN